MSITNFRDIGGYMTADGHQVKRGVFYRSAPIVFQHDEDREDFTVRKIKTILDLRSASEISAVPDAEVEGCAYIPCSAIPEESLGGGNLDMVSLIQNGDLTQLTKYIELIYTQLPFHNKAYQVLFDLLRRNETPIVFHCSAGKDRTGFAACLILKTLGVPDETILQDYMLSNVYREEENGKILAQFPQAAATESLLYVKESYLQSSLQAIHEKYTDFYSYLAAEYGITENEIAQFKNRYLEKTDEVMV